MDVSSKKMTEYATLKQAHGFNKGGIDFTDISPTIDTGLYKWHVLLIEVEEAEEFKEIFSEYIRNENG